MDGRPWSKSMSIMAEIVLVRSSHVPVTSVVAPDSGLPLHEATVASSTAVSPLTVRLRPHGGEPQRTLLSARFPTACVMPVDARRFALFGQLFLPAPLPWRKTPSGGILRGEPPQDREVGSRAAASPGADRGFRVRTRGVSARARSPVPLPPVAEVLGGTEEFRVPWRRPSRRSSRHCPSEHRGRRVIAGAGKLRNFPSGASCRAHRSDRARGALLHVTSRPMPSTLQNTVR